MKICRQYQMNMFLEPDQNEIRIPPTDRDQMKELLGKLMITVLDEKKRKERKKEKRSPEVRKEEHRENLSLKETEHE